MAKLPYDGVVLAGGRSQRMGRPKEDLPWPYHGTLLQHARATLEEAVSGRVWVSGGIDLPDRVTGGGPLAGIEAALCRTSRPWLAVLAVDLPLVPATLFELLDQRRQDPCDVLVPVSDTHHQPLASLWSRSLQETLHAWLANPQNRRVDDFLAQHTHPRHLRLATECVWLENSNTPRDYARARTRALLCE